MNTAFLLSASMTQRSDAHYYDMARFGYDCTTGERDKAALQRFAAKRSQQTREKLFALVEGK
jgi:hypothetical protein